MGVPEAFTEPVADPLGDLVARYARTHGPFTAAAAAGRYGLGPAVVTMTLRRLGADGRVVEGEFRPAGASAGDSAAGGTEWCDAEVLRLLRRRCLARLRKEAEPVPPEVLARFLPEWHGIGSPGVRRRADAGAVLEVVERLAGARCPRPRWRRWSCRDGCPATPRPARRADLGGRGGLVRRRSAARRRRLAGAGARRRRRPDAARTRRGQRDPAAFGCPGGAQRRRGAVLPDAQRPGRGTARGPGCPAARRQRDGRGYLGPGLGRAAH